MNIFLLKQTLERNRKGKQIDKKSKPITHYSFGRRAVLKRKKMKNGRVQKQEQ